MFYLTYGEKGPRVVLVQALLRLKGFNVRVTGEWSEHDDTMKAVEQLRAQLNLSPPVGAVDARVFFNLIQDTKLKVIDSIDANAGRSRKFAERDMKEYGIDPLLNERHPGHGVSVAVNKIIARSHKHKTALLRIHGHGNRGTWISVAIGDPVHTQTEGRIKDYETMRADWKSYIDLTHFERLRPTLVRLRPSFARFGSAEINCCTIGKNTALLQKLAETWKVPVTGGIGLQNPGGTLGALNGETWGRYEINEHKDRVCGTFVFEGEVYTAYPDGGNLKTWAAGVEASLLNLPKMALQIQQACPIIFGK